MTISLFDNPFTSAAFFSEWLSKYSFVLSVVSLAVGIPLANRIRRWHRNRRRGSVNVKALIVFAFVGTIFILAMMFLAAILGDAGSGILTNG